MQRHISAVGLLFMSMSAIIGSGWLFAEAYAWTFAGSAAMASWIIGAVLVTLVAFTFAELCTMIPLVGSSTRIPPVTHWTMTSYLFAWITWISSLIYAPTEVQATIQYLSIHVPSLAASADGTLSVPGYAVAFCALLVFSVFNVFSLRWLVNANSFLTVIKVILPVVLSVLILQQFYSSFQEIVRPRGAAFAPNGIHGILSAISIGGIVFAFNGFKLAAEMAGDCRNPKVALPIAIIGSILICLLVYLLLQVAYLSTLSAQADDGVSRLGPFAALAKEHHLTTMVPIIYAGAIVAPLAAGLMYFSSASKSLYGMSQNGYLPRFFGTLNAHGNPVSAIVITFLAGSLVFVCFRGWDTMAAIITVLFALSYVVGPICLGAMRDKLPGMHRPFRLRCSTLWSVFAFYACAMMFFWCGWVTIVKADMILAAGVVCLLLYKFATRRQRRIRLDVKPSLWLWCFLFGVTLTSYLCTYGEGFESIEESGSMIVLFLLSVVCYFLAVRYSLPAAEMSERVAAALQEAGGDGAAGERASGERRSVGPDDPEASRRLRTAEGGRR